MHFTLRLTLIFYCLTILSVIPGRSQDFNFSKLDISSQSSWVVATGITQDRNGLMWFSGFDGVNSYDGYRFTAYRNDPANPGSLAESRTECMYADSSGLIWVGTHSSGLDCLDPTTGMVKHYKHDGKNTASLGDNFVKVIFEDHEGIFWIGTMRGLDRFDRKTGKFEHFVSAANDSTSLSHNHVRAIYEDRQHELWIGTGSPWGDGTLPGEGGLNRFNRNTGKFTRYMHDAKNEHTLIDNRVRAILEDSKGNFWIGTAGDGLHLMDRKTGTFQRLTNHTGQSPFPARPSLNSTTASGAADHITFIKEDAAGLIWIGTLGNGMVIYDPATKQSQRISNMDSTGASNDHETFSFFISKDHVTWVSTWGGSVYRLSPQRSLITHVRTKFPYVIFYQNDSADLWAGSGKGLIHLNPNSGDQKIYTHNPRSPKTISSDSVYAVATDGQHGIWVGSYGGGLDHLTNGGEAIAHYRYNPNDKTSLCSNRVMTLLSADDSTLWVGTENGLDRMNTKSGIFTHYTHLSDSASLPSNNIAALLADKHNQYLWIANLIAGVDRLNIRTGKFDHFLPNGLTTGLISDYQGNVWVTLLSGGLYRFNEEKNSFEKYFDPNGYIQINGGKGLVEDMQHNLWVVTAYGLLRINEKRDEILLLNENNGIKNKDFYTLSAYMDRSGKLYFPYYPDGYYCFYPGGIAKEITKPLIYLSEFKLDQEIIYPGKDGPLQEPLNEATEIHLRYDQNSFSFNFAPISYNSPADNRVVFKLENYDKEFRKSGVEKTVQYYNVPPGEYEFRIRASTNMGSWTERKISIIITPPWWATWWAYGLYILLAGSAVWAFILYRSRTLMMEKKMLEHKVSVRTAEVVRQKEEINQTLLNLKSAQAQLIQSEKMASLGELTAGVAHEIQNPLNFVNNFSEVTSELLEELKEDSIKKLPAEEQQKAIDLIRDATENLEKIIHHGKRADAIVKGMLQHSRTGSGTKEPTDLNALADEYFRLSYYGLRAKDKSFNASLKSEFDAAIEMVNLIPQDFGRVLLNLFNNAFYAVFEKKKLLEAAGKTGSGQNPYSPEVFVSTKKANGRIEIRVQDNGNGIPEKVLDKIFQPFFTTKPTGQGTGLGLSLSYDIVKAHGGEIKVHTKVGEGTEFVVELPV